MDVKSLAFILDIWKFINVGSVYLLLLFYKFLKIVKIAQLIKILKKELIDRTKGKYKSSWLIAQLEIIELSNREYPQWVKDLIKQHENNK